MDTKPNLREWLDKTETTTGALAEKSGISRATISYILNGRSEANFSTARAIWKATDYEVRLVTLYPDLSKVLDDISHISREDVVAHIE